MLYIDIKYVEIVSPKLKNYKKKNAYLWNFSCPICKDSKRNSLKARGFIYKIKNSLNYKCHNCGISTSFGNFLKFIDSKLENEYNLEKYKSNTKIKNTPTPDFFDEFKKENHSVISYLTDKDSCINLPNNHPIRKYLSKRKIPDSHIASLYWVANFKEWVNKHIAPKFASVENDHPRLIIPFYDKNKKLLAIQGRSFGKEIPKYYTIKTDEKNEKIFGLERLNENNTIYAVEGPIDSLFLPNAVAVAGTSFDSKTLLKLKDKITVVIDNEPRNVEVCKAISKCISLGYAVCLFPTTVKGKDINEIVLKQPSIDLVKLIETNTYRGLEAEFAFKNWIRCTI